MIKPSVVSGQKGVFSLSRHSSTLPGIGIDTAKQNSEDHGWICQKS
jgi:hypothetical protein